MAKKTKQLTREELKSIRLEKTKNYLESIGVIMPVLSEAKAVATVDIIKNKDFTKMIDVFVIDRLVELSQNDNFAKLMSKKTHRKTVLDRFIKERLEPAISQLSDVVWDILISSIMVDSIDDESGEWLDFELPAATVSEQIYKEQTSWVKDNLKNIGVLDLKLNITDYIDYVSMKISINLFRFTRQVDEQSKYQLMGNIGSIDDIRNTVETTFIGEVFGDIKNKEWVDKIIEEIK